MHYYSQIQAVDGTLVKSCTELGEEIQQCISQAGGTVGVASSK